jgi:tRNA dimethylallyltransferase
MWPHNLPNPLLVIIGPTAVGKTELALQLAEHLNGEIVSADSRLFYRGMDIGTAKPLPSELARVPHHLIDVADPDQVWSLASFQQAARQAIAEIQARGRLPLLVGGTGQYVRAVLQDWDLPEQEADNGLRAALEHWATEIGPHGLHARLALLDPPAAGFIDARNVRRTIRALEVVLRTGRRFSDQRQHSSSPFSVLLIGLTRPRIELYQRVDQRIDAMLAAGLLDEVSALLARGYSPALPTLSAIGYREMVAHLRGEMTLADAIAQMKRITRRFVRHQGAWFREEDQQIHWFQAGSSTLDDVLTLVKEETNWLPVGTQIAE